jgi:hypothetical protein
MSLSDFGEIPFGLWGILFPISGIFTIRYRSIYNATNPVGRYAMPEEIANLALLMVGKTGDLIIGETFYITGGSGSISMHR